MDRIGERAKVWLAEKENTKNKLAGLLGISRPTLDKRLCGKSPWLWEEARIIARLTGCRISDFEE